MARHANRIPLTSINGYILRSISLREAFQLTNEEKARWIKNTKYQIVGIVLREPEGMERTSPCTITCSEAQTNAIGAVTPRLRRFARNENRQIMREKIGNYIDRAMSKVEAWPETHDTKATVISAGKAFGVFCLYPPMEERVVTFA